MLYFFLDVLKTVTLNILATSEDLSN